MLSSTVQYCSVVLEYLCVLLSIEPPTVGYGNTTLFPYQVSGALFQT